MKQTISPTSAKHALGELCSRFEREEAQIREGGGAEGKERQKRLQRLTARERIDLLLDNTHSFFELQLWAGWQMYQEWGGLPAAGVITGIGHVAHRSCMIIANDATVKAGAMFPQSVKKVLRAQRIAFECRLPVLFLVDSSGVFLPLQDEIFPDEDDFGRIFRNNAVFSAANIPQFAAIMGNCIAGGGYLPVLCDKLLMTEGSGLYLAGPALVKAAIGQVVDTEDLGGAQMHARISGTVDFLEPNDPACIERLRHLVAFLPEDPPWIHDNIPSIKPTRDIYECLPEHTSQGYDVRNLLACILDKDSMDEYKAEYGKTIVTGFARIGGIPVGVVANQRIPTSTGKGEIEIGGVIYVDSSEKTARFINDCNHMQLPILFFQDVMGFMVGKEAEQAGIIKAGAKLVHAVSNCTVPKITLIMGNSFGAGHYALCGKAYDPHFILAWPQAKYAVMGAEQAADTLLSVKEKAAQRKGVQLDNQEIEKMRKDISQHYIDGMDIRYGAARGWIDAIIPPHKTREALLETLQWAKRTPPTPHPFTPKTLKRSL